MRLAEFKYVYIIQVISARTPAMHTQWYPGEQFSPKMQTPVLVRAVVGIAQHPRLPPIVTLFQVITKAWDNVDEFVQLITLLLIDVTYTIDQLEKKQDKQTRKKK